MMALALAVGWLAFGDAPVANPCREDHERPSEPPRREDGAVYRRVGDLERRNGHLPAARIAYRQALRSDPTDRLARAGLLELCERAPGDPGGPSGPEGREGGADPAGSSGPPVAPRLAGDDAELEAAVALMRRGESAQALRVLEDMRGAGAEPDPALALLAGICAYELGDDALARRRLEEARAEPRIAATTTFFLGLVALREGDGPLATTLLAAAAAREDGLARLASPLIGMARREGRIVTSAMVELGYDSNVALAPDGSLLGGGAGDAHGDGLLALFLRPLAGRDAYLRFAAQYRKQQRLSSFDLGDVSGAAGVRHRAGAHAALSAEYAYDWLALGGAPYLSAHRVLGAARSAHDGWALGARYSARLASFSGATAGPYSGVRQDAQAVGEVNAGPAVSIGVGYRGAWDVTRSAALGHHEHGPTITLRCTLAEAYRLLAEASATWRRYPTIDPDLLVERADRYLDAGLGAEADLGERWTLRLAMTARRARSNVAELSYVKSTVALGLIYTAGVR
jgi:tetratricopeptide (TPR) repeat protein